MGDFLKYVIEIRIRQEYRILCAKIETVIPDPTPKEKVKSSGSRCILVPLLEVGSGAKDSHPQHFFQLVV